MYHDLAEEKERMLPEMDQEGKGCSSEHASRESSRCCSSQDDHHLSQEDRSRVDVQAADQETDHEKCSSSLGRKGWAYIFIRNDIQ